MNIKLNAELRNDQGKGASRRLRHQGMVPAIVYGAGKEPLNLSINLNTITNMLEDEALYTSIIDIDIAGDVNQAIIKDIQRHPARNTVSHIDFLRVDDKVEIVTRVPLSFTGTTENKSIRLGAVMNQFINMVEVSCLPKDLPNTIEVNIADVKVGESLRLTDLTMADGVTITALNHKDIQSYNQTVVSISAARKMVVLEEEAPAADGEADAEAAAE